MKFSDEENRFLINNYQLMPYKEIARILGRKEASVNDRLRKLGLTKNKKTKWTDEEIQLLKKEYPINPYVTDLFPNRTKQSVHSKAHELKLNRMNRGMYPVNVHYFKQWSKDMAYILGLIAADGNVILNPKVLTIVLHRQDRYMLDLIKEKMELERPISSRKSNCDALTVRCGTIVDDLINLGIIPKKSLTLEWIDVPTQYLKDFIRGYMDGDGSVSYYIRKDRNELILEVSMLGTEKFLHGMSVAINREIGLKVMKTSKPKGFINGKEFRNISKIKYSGSTACKLLDWLYEDSELFLRRKKDKYIEFLVNR